MLLLTFQLSDYHRQYIFDRAYRTKQDILQLLLYSTKLILNTEPISYARSTGSYLFLKVEKMSRLIFFTDGKAFSISFPFQYFNYDEFDKYSPTILMNGLDYKVDNSVIAYLENILSNLDLDNVDIWDILESLESLPKEHYNSLGESTSFDKFMSKLFLKLVLNEDGYLRYDYDEIGFKPENPDLHPYHHIDVFYSSNPTFKIGLKKSINYSEFINIINIRTDCRYLIT
ncbi:hypothetical protein [uncultured Acinetobacter sp.]|uniref:hypothetical protein n=1 Tax=uncultured Acinetobacter sp. TaxID=165433 RepID=UPI00258C3812|nr:hypothetical protein [uncultured Acinetobacter sp.]